jgi:hypothetical protein
MILPCTSGGMLLPHPMGITLAGMFIVLGCFLLLFMRCDGYMAELSGSAFAPSLLVQYLVT